MADAYADLASALVEKQDLPGAYKACSKAWRLKRTYDIATLLAIIETGLEAWRDAAEHLAYALERWPADEVARPTPRLETMRWLLEFAKGKVGTARVRLTADDGRSVNGAEVLADSAFARRWPLGSPPVIFVDPGRRTFVARLPGCKDAIWRGDVKANTTFDVSLTLACRDDRLKASPPAAPRR